LRVGLAFAEETPPKFREGVIVGMLYLRFGHVCDTEAASMRPFDILGIAKLFIEWIVQQVLAPCGRGGQREEEMPFGGSLPVSEGTAMVFANEELRIRAWKLVAVGGVSRSCQQRCDESLEPVAVLRDGIGVVEDDEVAVTMRDHIVEAPSWIVFAGWTGEEEGLREGGEDLRGAVA
jgi:hypothetical protein